MEDSINFHLTIEEYRNMKEPVMSGQNYLYIFFTISIIAAGQLVFKYSAGLLKFGSHSSYINFVQLNIFPLSLICIALALYLLSTFTWIMVLRAVPLSVAYMFNSISFILVPLAAVQLFNESLPKFYLMGVISIIFGVFLISRT